MSMHDFSTYKENAVAQCRLTIINVFVRKIRRKLVLRSGVLFASTEVMRRLRSDSPLHFDILNTYQIRTGK